MSVELTRELTRRKRREVPLIDLSDQDELESVMEKSDSYFLQKIQDRAHMQGFAILKDQMRIGKYTQTNKSGIKGLFESNSIHINFANGTPEQCRDYCSKKYNRCKDHNGCKCDYFNLEKMCDKCDENCTRTLARVCDVNKNDTNSGPWEFGDISVRSNNQVGNNINKYTKNMKSLEIEYMKEAINKIIKGENVDKTIVEYAPMILSRVTISIDRIKKAVDNIDSKFMERCWKPCNIYIFGTPGTGKTFWSSIVFPNAYKKSMDEDWKWVQVKNSSREYIGMYQVFTSNSGLRELYDYWEDLPFYVRSNGYRIPNRKYYSAVERRFDFVVEYRRYRDDNIPVCSGECVCCKVRRIFHKGSKEKFQKLEFDVEFNEGVTQEYVSRIVKKLSKKGKLLKMGNKIIWRENFESNNRYVITDSNSDDGLVSDFITYPEIIKKLNERVVDFDDIEIIEEIDICELGGESSGSKKRDYENDNNFNLKRQKISDVINTYDDDIFENLDDV
ncbi:8714_t:CDS:2 [Acaulospora morrowiae]|uniref:8714_t:CDS:1 n=1 Tax=Acaulospora morrowiae TaxID=94023 RepID=A0A9N9H3N9_9GLOM|nr:8714_t:CDS:2 [Acaulospora morrowiae]